MFESNDGYFDRNQAVLVLAILANLQGIYCGIKESDDPDWPILFVDLPNTGQVSWHIPKEIVSDNFMEYHDDWDGHTVEEKRERMKRFIETYGN